MTIEYLPGPEWRYRDALVIFVAMVAGSFVGAIALTVAIAGEASGTEQLLFLAGGQFLAGFAFLVYQSRQRGSGSLTADYGLVVRFEDIWAFFLGVGGSLVLGIVTAWVFDLLDVQADQQGVADLVADSAGVAGTIVVVLIVLIAAPVVEEILFRGVLLAALTRRFAVWPAITISAAAFAFTHLTDPNAIYAVPALFVLGLLFGWLAVRSRDLSGAILCHMGVNSLAVVQLFVV